MPNITLPDGSVRQFDAATTGAEIAASIGKGLARDAVAVKVDGEMYDLTRDIDSDVQLEIVTRDTEDGLELLRHDKKVRGGHINFVLARGIGQAFVADDVATDDVLRHLEGAIAA